MEFDHREAEQESVIVIIDTDKKTLAIKTFDGSNLTVPFMFLNNCNIFHNTEKHIAIIVVDIKNADIDGDNLIITDECRRMAYSREFIEEMFQKRQNNL